MMTRQIRLQVHPARRAPPAQAHLLLRLLRANRHPQTFTRKVTPPPQRSIWDNATNNFATWVRAQLDEVSLQATFDFTVQTVYDPPSCIRIDYKRAKG